MNKLSDKEITHLINQDIPYDSEDGLDSDDMNNDDDFDTFCNNVLNENDNDALFDLLNEQFGQFNTPLDSAVVFNEPADDDDLNVVTINSEPSIFNINSTIFDISNSQASSSSSSVISNVINSNPSSRCIREKKTLPIPQLNTNSQTKKKPIIVKNVRWSTGNLSQIPCSFQGNTDLPENIIQLETPLQIFKYFFTDDLNNHICDESQKYNTQNNINNPIQITSDDLNKFIGVLNLMSIVNITNVRHYWCSVLGNPLIKDTMTVNKFEKIRQCLHFNDNTLNTVGPNRDKLFKIRPILETLKKRFLTVPLEENLSVDEQLCSTLVLHNRQEVLLRYIFLTNLINGDINFVYYVEYLGLHITLKSAVVKKIKNVFV